MDETDPYRHIPDREKELKGKIDKAVSSKKKEVTKDEDEYDIIAENKRNLEKKKKENKEFAQISKSVMSNKNRKLLKVIEKSVNDKKEVS